MIPRSRYWLAAALGVCMAHAPALFAATPRSESPLTQNQKIADAIADQLRQSAVLHGYNVDVAFQNGAANLTGTVADSAQRDEALRIVHGVPGVEQVQDRLTVAGTVTPVRADAPPIAFSPAPIPEPSARRNDGPAPGVAPLAPPAVEPAPVFQAPAPSPYDLNPPKMPPYAWPTYAPYNNYSRVAYPLDYPYNAWPYIGPCYPFPKVPLGWRSVKLEWDDGYWWFSKTATKNNWWHLRYW